MYELPLDVDLLLIILTLIGLGAAMYFRIWWMKFTAPDRKRRLKEELMKDPRFRPLSDRVAHLEHAHRTKPIDWDDYEIKVYDRD